MPDGYIKIPKDCSKGAGGWFNYVCYKKDSSASPIRQIKSEITPNARANGSSQDDWSMVKGSDNGDLNRGSSGKYIYLYLNRTEQSNNPGYIDLDILYGADAVVPEGWEKVSSDLNESVKGEYVYLVAKMA